MVIEILLNNDIQLFFCSNDFTLSKGIFFSLCTLLKFKKNKLESFHLNKISIRYEFHQFHHGKNVQIQSKSNET
jgi:hypothetical protein